MKNLIAYKRSILSVFIALAAIVANAQKKYVESFEVNDDATIVVNTSYTNIVFETWNKNKVEVEAFIEGEDLTEEEKQEIFDNWNFQVLGNSNTVMITSRPQMAWGNNISFSNMDALKELKFLDPMLKDMPVMTKFEMPELPMEALQSMGDLKFDYEEFNKNEEEYMKKWEKQIEKKFGKDFEIKMEKWGEEFAKEWNAKNGEKISAEWEAKMEAWGKKFGKEMEAWGANFEKDMQKLVEKYEKENGKGSYTKEVITTPNGNKTIIFKANKNGKIKDIKATKTLIIRMPKDSKTEIDVRHGEIKMADARNVRATLNHTPFIANSIDGGKTLINASYAPVIIDEWKYGTLYVRFVDNCSIGTIEAITLRSNSSDVLIGTIIKDANLTGSLGNFKINGIAKNFGTINIVLKNNDAIINIPDSSFSFLFDGKKSTLKYPKSLELTNTKKGDRVLVKGFNNTANSSNNLKFEALYSNITVE